MAAGKNPEPRRTIKETPPFKYEIEDYVLLPKISSAPQISFLEVLAKRRSVRTFQKLNLDQVSVLLWHSAKASNITVAENGTWLSSRPAPSAGSIHPIDVFISLPESLPQRRLRLYDPVMHRLASVKINAIEHLNFFENINQCLILGDATVIWFAAYAKLTGAKYKNPESLVWRDAGALTMTFQLVSTALDLNSCPIGTLGQPFLPRSLNNTVISAGGLLIG